MEEVATSFNHASSIKFILATRQLWSLRWRNSHSGVAHSCLDFLLRTDQASTGTMIWMGQAIQAVSSSMQPVLTRSILSCQSLHLACGHLILSVRARYSASGMTCPQSATWTLWSSHGTPHSYPRLADDGKQFYCSCLASSWSIGSRSSPIYWPLCLPDSQIRQAGHSSHI